MRMIERVARMLCERADNTYLPDTRIDGVPWWKRFESDAHDVIEVMREPDEGMVKVARSLYDGQMFDSDIKQIYQSMIDEALK